MSSRLTKVDGEKYLYQNADGVYFLRKRTEIEDTDVSLNTTKKTKACELRDDWMHAQKNQELGITPPPAKIKRVPTCTDTITLYEKGGYKTKKGRPHGEKHLRFEQDACELLKKFFKNRPWAEVDQDLLDDYHDWRVENVKQGEGHKTTDMELTVLSNAFWYAKRKKKITHNPIAIRDKYHSPKDSRHAKDCCPKNADEFADVARLLFSHRHSEVLGWQMMFEGCCGVRTKEALGLKFKPAAGEPGDITGSSMLVKRAKKGEGGDNSYTHIQDEFKVVLDAHEKWKEERYPGSPWMFPGRDRAAKGPVHLQALVKALDRLFEDGKCRKFTSHGMRAFKVLVQRSNGVKDEQIAVGLNHTGGVDSLRQAYGAVPPEWLDGNGPKLTYLPKDPSKYPWLAIKQLTKAQARRQYRADSRLDHKEEVQDSKKASRSGR